MMKVTFKILNYCLLDIDWESVRKSITFAEKQSSSICFVISMTTFQRILNDWELYPALDTIIRCGSLARALYLKIVNTIPKSNWTREFMTFQFRCLTGDRHCTFTMQYLDLRIHNILLSHWRQMLYLYDAVSGLENSEHNRGIIEGQIECAE
ncbi:hypothetical protein BDR05DRAFT_953581 [Suillus weaverae]|nr:hypothetical protein BDR05DRAFT_953581 [Suillus weaverae]